MQFFLRDYLKTESSEYFTEPQSEGRIGDWMETYHGVQFYPQDPRPDEILIEDIAHALSNQCRFAGHVDNFYSVAQHSVLVSTFVPEALALTALLHDASEAYLVDIPRPLKPYLTGYADIENKVMTAVAIQFSMIWPMPKAVKAADNLALAIEKRCFKKNSKRTWDVEELDTTKSIQIVPLLPKDAEKLFLDRFEELCEKTGQ